MMTFHHQYLYCCRFSNSVSSSGLLNCTDAACLTSCHLGFRLRLMSFLQNSATHPLPTYPIAEGRGPDPFGRFRHVTARSQPQLTRSPASVGDEDPAAHGNGAVLLTVTAYMAYGASRGATIEGHPVGHRRSR